eukprot:CAMPEP_0184698664 /NCGR_PEP_ID=MMETSP0313-20130426/5202_1 /TAXON_ID=2792 /ORGANISM="Porphyridium aerugineum, Strain SAG 1380-2" /LENGTH=232 /DNA_ID=CAMNT_0027157633 /DNA_START=206 /DNA_END=904 /DNA_ORIENTATION=+
MAWSRIFWGILLFVLVIVLLIVFPILGVPFWYILIGLVLISVIASVIIWVHMVRQERRDTAERDIRLLSEVEEQVRIQRYVNGPQGAGKGSKTLGLWPFEVDTYCPKSTQEENSSEQRQLCCICLDSIDPGMIKRTLPCDHEFHSECISAWVVKRATCPLCNAKLKLVAPPRELEEVVVVSEGQQTESTSPSQTLDGCNACQSPSSLQENPVELAQQGASLAVPLPVAVLVV